MRNTLNLSMLTGVLLLCFTGCKNNAEIENITLNHRQGKAASPSLSTAIGQDWTDLNPQRRIQLDNDPNGSRGEFIDEYVWNGGDDYQSVGDPLEGEYSANYISDDMGLSETFRLVIPKCARSEVRTYNANYKTGSRQFEGFVKFSAPLNDQMVMQIFGSTAGGATQLGIRGYSENGGTLKANGVTIATGIYDQEVRINVIHLQENVLNGNKILVYVNMQKKYERIDGELANNYMKYGCYGGKISNQTVQWRKVRILSGGTL